MTKNSKIWKAVRNTEDAPITQGFPTKGDIIVLPAMDNGEIVKSYEVISDPVIHQVHYYYFGQKVVYLQCRVIDIECGRERTFRWGRGIVLVPA